MLLISVGVFLIMFDPWSYRIDSVLSKSGIRYKHSPFWVDLVMICSNFVTAAFYMLNKLLMKDRTMKHLFLLSLLISLVTCVFAILFEGARLDFTPLHGLFGWLDSKLLFLTVFANGFIATFLATLGPLLCL